MRELSGWNGSSEVAKRDMEQPWRSELDEDTGCHSKGLDAGPQEPTLHGVIDAIHYYLER